VRPNLAKKVAESPNRHVKTPGQRWDVDDDGPMITTSVKEPLVFDAIRIHVRKILRTKAADREAEDAKIREIEAAGGKVVDGGQTDNQGWEITD
jgi:hypothetical protein